MSGYHHEHITYESFDLHMIVCCGSYFHARYDLWVTTYLPIHLNFTSHVALSNVSTHIVVFTPYHNILGICLPRTTSVNYKPLGRFHHCILACMETWSVSYLLFQCWNMKAFHSVKLGLDILRLFTIMSGIASPSPSTTFLGHGTHIKIICLLPLRVL